LNNGRPGLNLLLRDGTETELPDKVTLEARKHDIIRVQTPGGGAWGKQLSV
jgi:N-methylhydantoinase B